MATETVEVNLAATDFPLLSGFAGRQIFVPAREDTSTISDNAARNYRLKTLKAPRVIYVENVLPTELGYQSIDFIQAAEPTTIKGFRSIYKLQGVDGDNIYFAYTNGKAWFLSGNATAWAVKTFNGVPTPVIISIAYLHGKTYVFFKEYGCYAYTVGTDTWASVTLTGLNVAEIFGICAANNYLIAYTADRIYWSSATAPTVFTVISGNGAGSENVRQLRGHITCVLPLGDGYVIYTTANAIYAAYSGNITFPWVWSEIKGSAGVIDSEHVAHENNSESHIAWTTAGLMEVTNTSAELIFPEVTDFLSGRSIETYLDGIFSEQRGTIRIKVTYVNRRYVVISYGLGGYNYALVYDKGYSRWGKLKIDHVDAFEYAKPSVYNYVTYAELVGTYAAQTTTYADYSTVGSSYAIVNESFGFLLNTGEIRLVELERTASQEDGGVLGTILLGKLQFTHDNYIEFQELETTQSKGKHSPLYVGKPSPIQLAVLNSLTGDEFTQVTELEETADSTNIVKKFKKRITGLCQLLSISGAFRLTFVKIRAQLAGSVR
jgi:hypothetical protein